MGWDDGSYNEVPVRIAEFRAKYPEGSLQPADPLNPFSIVEVGDKTFLAYVAAAYRTPDDNRPGIGSAWEPVPGLTNFTRNSELQNAETSAWGRAIIAVGAADAKKGIASAEDVRNRQAEAGLRRRPLLHPDAVARFLAGCERDRADVDAVVWAATAGRTSDPNEVYGDEGDALRQALKAFKIDGESEAVPPTADAPADPVAEDGGTANVPSSPTGKPADEARRKLEAARRSA